MGFGGVTKMGHLKIMCLGCGEELVDEKWDDVKSKSEAIEYLIEKKYRVSYHLQNCSNPTIRNILFSVIFKP